MKLPGKLQPPADLRWSGPLIASSLAIAIAAIALLLEVPGLASAVISPGESSREFDLATELAAKHDRQAEVNARRFEGRSPFIVPSRPPTRPVSRPKPEERPKEPAPTRPKAPTGPPKTYQGPKPVGVAVNAVFFENGDVIYQGQERGGVTVLAVLGPNEVRLGHRGGEYQESFLMGETGSLFTPFSFPPDAASVLTGGPSGTNSGSRPASTPSQPRQPAGNSGNLPKIYSTAELEKMDRSQLIDAMRTIMRALSRGDIDESVRKQYVDQREQIQNLISKARSGRG